MGLTEPSFLRPILSGMLRKGHTWVPNRLLSGGLLEIVALQALYEGSTWCMTFRQVERGAGSLNGTHIGEPAGGYFVQR
jgi:hypothetical protein